jgi:hypothetical protein
MPYQSHLSFGVVLHFFDGECWYYSGDSSQTLSLRSRSFLAFVSKSIVYFAPHATHGRVLLTCSQT